MAQNDFNPRTDLAVEEREQYRRRGDFRSCGGRVGGGGTSSADPSGD